MERPQPNRSVLAAIFIGALPIALLIVVAIQAIGRYVSVPRYAAINSRIVAEMRTAIAPGMPRTDVYAWLRAHNLTATNPRDAVWRVNGLGQMVRVDDNTWPKPRVVSDADDPAEPNYTYHPEVNVRLDAGWTGSCSAVIYEDISFDSRDRVAKVTYNSPEWSCV
ncbi:MAG: hypothetical protein ABSB70_14575 [Candidatus Velthaea sp.]|jgi:hypothetical protein